MVVKQIIFDEQTGRLILSDNNNNHYFCDIYGRKKTTFLPYISGHCTYKERLGKLLNSLDTVERPIDSFDKFKHKYYLPCVKKFEGYFPFPNPVSKPFSNIPKYEISDQYREKLVKVLVKHFKVNKNEKIFNIPEGENKGASYFTYPINPDDYSKDDRDSLIKLIDEHFAEFREQYKYKMNLMPKDPVVKALKRFKNLLLQNEDIKVINGRTLPAPSDEVKEKYTIIAKTMKKLKNNDNDKDKRSRSNIKVFQSPDIIAGSPNKVTNMFNTVKSDVNSDDLQDNLSCLSIETQNEKKYYEENILALKSIKSLDFLRKSLDKEKLFMDGFKEIPEKEEGIIRKKLKRPFKSNGELYDENIVLLQKVNPIAFELRRKKDDYDRKELEKKRSQKYIFQKNLGF